MPATKGPTKTQQFRDFSGGLNRTAARTALKDTQLFWNENVQPIGPGQGQTLPPRAAPLVTIAAGVASLWGINIKIGGVEVGRLITVNVDGSMTAITPITGATVSVAPAGTVTAEARLVMWQDTPLLIGDPTKGYMSWDGTTLVKYPLTVTGDTNIGSPVVVNVTPGTAGLAGNTPGMAVAGAGIPLGASILSVDSPTQITLDANATATASTVTLTVGAGAPTSVRDLAVFEGRVWLVSALRAITFTAPASYTDFATGDGSGTASIIDSIFVGSITRLLSALELLWIIGPSAVNTISNVQATGGPVITTFSNTNIVSNVGSVRGASVASFFRTFLFLAPYGVYAIVGATPQKLSDDLDGLFPFLHQDAAHVNPAATFALNDVFVWAVYVHYIDPLQGHRPILLCFARNAWFVASQGDDLTYIASLVDPATGDPQLWGTNGSGVFRCFAGTGANTYQWQTKLWDFGNFTQRKQALRLGFEFSNTTGQAITPEVFLENENSSVPVPVTLTPNEGTWLAADGSVGTWFAADSTIGHWLSTGFQLVRTGELNFSGQYLGVRVQGSSNPFTISAFALEYQLEGEWTF